MGDADAGRVVDEDAQRRPRLLDEQNFDVGVGLGYACLDVTLKLGHGEKKAGERPLPKRDRRPIADGAKAVSPSLALVA
jgi:hypothetical protein